MHTQHEIDALRKRIAEQEEDQGWNLSQNLYNRDWKKELAQSKRALAAMLKAQAKK